MEYHEDGVAFWLRHGVHHPFLLPEYRGDGRRYHRTFSRIGFTPRHAELVSFVELLHVPSVGRSKLAPQDLDPAHLPSNQRRDPSRPSEAHLRVGRRGGASCNQARHFLGCRRRPPDLGPFAGGTATPSRAVYSHLHFSNYGKFQLQLEEESRAIAALVPTDA